MKKKNILQVVFENSVACNSLAELWILNATETRFRLLAAEISENSLVCICVILV